MKHLMVLFIVFGMFQFSSAAAKKVVQKGKPKLERSLAQTPCGFVRWPFGSDPIGTKDYATLEKMDRKLLYRYFLFELSNEESRSHVVKGLYKYLLGSESNADLRAFLEVAMAASGAMPVETTEPKPLRPAEVCELYQRVKTQLPLE